MLHEEWAAVDLSQKQCMNASKKKGPKTTNNSAAGLLSKPLPVPRENKYVKNGSAKSSALDMNVNEKTRISPD